MKDHVRTQKKVQSGFMPSDYVMAKLTATISFVSLAGIIQRLPLSTCYNKKFCTFIRLMRLVQQLLFSTVTVKVTNYIQYHMKGMQQGH